MQFKTVTALFGMLLASAPALANPVEKVEARQSPVGTCGSQFGAPITAFPIGEACNGDGFACDPSCTDIVRTPSLLLHFLSGWRQRGDSNLLPRSQKSKLETRNSID